MELKNMKVFILISSIMMIFLHFALWVILLYNQEHTIQWTYLNRILDHWDAGWYTKIVLNGYEENQSIAFYPLFPLFIFIIKLIVPIAVYPALIGTIFSTILFLLFCLLLLKLIQNKDSSLPPWLIPKNKFVWFLFVFSPASYVFHTSHTESLFLLLSFSSIYLAFKKHWISAAVIAGLCSLTKNQGIILAIAIAFISLNNYKLRHQKIKIFLFSGLISGAFFSCFLIYQYLAFKNAFAFLNAQSNWHHIQNISEYFKTFILQNTVQDYSFGAIKHHIFFFIMLFFCFFLWKHSKPIFFYCLTCLLVLPMQAELINSFRFASFLFPIFFIISTYSGKYRKPLFIFIAILFVFLNIQTAYNFYILKWAY
jgi:Gpi18-like mannosyltransferase